MSKTRVMDQFSKSFKATNFSEDPKLGHGPKVVEIENAHVIEIRGERGTREMCKITFKGLNRYWLAGKGEALPMLIDVLGSEFVEDWIGCKIELYMDITDIGGDPGPCIRPRAIEGAHPTEPDGPPKARKLKRPAEPEGYPRVVGECEDGDLRVQFYEFGSQYEVPPDIADKIMAGQLSEDELEKMFQ